MEIITNYSNDTRNMISGSSYTLPPGLNENVIKTISNKKGEPKWLLDWRLKAYKRWKKMKTPKIIVVRWNF